jgi:hypothetical protein
MSVIRETTIPCEQCETDQPFVMRMQIDVAKWPQGKEELLEGRLNTFVCAKCGFSKMYDFILLYEDREKGLMVLSAPQSAEIELKPEFAHFAEDFQLRKVSSRNELIEKVVIRDAELDDCVVEYVKVQLRNESLRRSMPIDGDLMFSDLGKNDDGETVLEFQDFTGDKDDVFFAFPIELYHEFARDLEPYIPKMPKQDSPWLRVGREYGKQLERLVEGEEDKPRGRKRKR